jgi:8-oxo-dGTP pyrophosphatase MutT (NUDIX family)
MGGYKRAKYVEFREELPTTVIGGRKFLKEEWEKGKEYQSHQGLRYIKKYIKMTMSLTYRSRIIDALSSFPIDYIEQIQFLKNRDFTGERWIGAGVLFILQFSKDKEGEGNFSILLNKRSQRVKQAGDLCFPGGSPSPILDKLLSLFFKMGILPLSRGEGFRKAKKERGKRLLSVISIYLTVALREAWEEIRLNPFHIDFLGPLPSYRLELFKRILFPMVMEIRSPIKLRPNWEVERIFTIPIDLFFNPENYAIYSIKVRGELREIIGDDLWEFPCLIINEKGKREILWGATFNLIISFLRIVSGFEPPEISSDKRVWGELYSTYLYGSRRKERRKP